MKMANITRRGKNGDHFLIRVTMGTDVSGKQIIKSMTWKPDKPYTEKQMLKEVERAAALFEERLKNSTASVDGRIKLIEFIPTYLEDMQDELSPNSMSAYKRVIDNFIVPALGHLKLKDIKPTHIQKFVNLLASGDYRMDGKEGKKYAPATVHRYYVVLQSIMSHAYGLELIQKNPTDTKKIKLPSIGEQKTEIYEAAELSAMLKCLKKESLMFQLLIHLAINSGCRRGELVALEWKDINFNAGVATIRKSAYCIKGEHAGIKCTKNGKTRRITLADYIVDMLLQYKQEQDCLKQMLGTAWEGDDWIFIQDTGCIMYPTSPTEMFSDFLEKNGLPHRTFHSLRHTSATLSLANSTDIKSVAERLGHSQLKTTDRYVHALEATERKAAQTLGGYIQSLADSTS